MLFLWPQAILAVNSPILTSPADNETISKSPKLIWDFVGECVESGSCFLVEVDNNPDFSSKEKSSYTDKNAYSPQGLTEGVWYWHVKAKDKSQNWSEWSSGFKFIISAQASSPPANPQSSPTPQTPQPSPASQKSEKKESTFSIKDAPTEMASDQEFEVSVSLKLENNPNQPFFLKGAFKSSDSSNYFGETYAKGWINNSTKYSEQLKIQTDSGGRWEGKIKIRADEKDSGFNGTGNYILKVGRYSESGSGPTWSNEVNLKINAVETKKENAKEEIADESPGEEDEEIDISGSIVGKTAKNYDIKIASVAGVSQISNNTPLEPETAVLQEKQINWILIISGLGILAGTIGFIFYKFRKGKLNAINTH